MGDREERVVGGGCRGLDMNCSRLCMERRRRVGSRGRQNSAARDTDSGTDRQTIDRQGQQLDLLSFLVLLLLLVYC